MLPGYPGIITISMSAFLAKAVPGRVACVPVCETTIAQNLHVEAILQSLVGFHAT